MLELAILGFLCERSLHGYDLRTMIAALTGHVRPVADGSLYTAIKRLERDGRLTRELVPGKAAARQALTLTDAGREHLLATLRDPSEVDVTDENRWFVVLAFLRHLDDPEQEAAVLRRRLAFIEQPASYFYDGDRPMQVADVDDAYRKGILRIARAASREEHRWITETLAALETGRPSARSAAGS